ncbi:MAG: UDP-N-acetylmuramate dehydrogenase [Burkholderiaceae bacterium]|nr:UDP-N-acetylmuramate dehydrogenase [Burkholderiaceae bacterium]
MLSVSSQDLTTFNTLGLASTASHLVRYQSPDQLADLLAMVQGYKDVLVLGGGSNVVLPAVLGGLVIKVESRGIRLLQESATHFIIEAQAGEVWHDFVDDCIRRGWWGLENLALIPGTVGAAPVQNIGAYGVELDQRLHSVVACQLGTGQMVEMSAQQCGFSYRNSYFKQQPAGQWLILKVRFSLPRQWSPVLTYPDLQHHPVLAAAGSPASARQVFDAVCEIRRNKLPDPAVLGNAGSFFKNPVITAKAYQDLLVNWPAVVAYPQAGGMYKLAAGWLIDQAGWKGRRLGPVGVHDRQALVLVNHGGATAGDIHQLAQAIQADVQQRFGVTLEQEPVNVVA